MIKFLKKRYWGVDVPNTEAVEKFWEKVIDIVVESSLLLVLVLLWWAEGILVLNVIVSFRRKKRQVVFNPLIGVAIGFGISIVPFICSHWVEVQSLSLTLDMLSDGLLSSVLITFPIVTILSIFGWIVKENLLMRGRHDNGE